MTVIYEDLGPQGQIMGVCAPEFSGVLDAFRANFLTGGEVGASVCLVRGDDAPVDLWGGIAQAGTADAAPVPWHHDTIGIVYSCTKGAAALCLHHLIDQGKIGYDDLVADIWPAFAVGGKAATTVAMMLCHTSPVPHLREPIAAGGLTDWDYMVDRVAAEPAFWQPGTRQGYHALTYAWTVGNLVRLIAGQPLGRYFADEIAGPLGLDFHIGLPAALESRVAPMIAPDRAEVNFASRFFQAATRESGSLPNLFLTNQGGADFNARDVHAAEIASANGMTNARGLAGLYAPLARGGAGVLRADTVARLGRVCAATLDDAVLMQSMRFGLGFMASIDNRASGGDSLLIGESAFGHVGMGGSVGFADPAAGIGFGYTMNRMGPGILLNARGQGLVDAVYQALGWSSPDSGAWRV
ncbi:serine hydrolase domain-containing protein [Novosphingobium sp.]|uniref:serine hydrolase domain-containing protein n=1 Tax=Novosphingobium sp. TaxID=1874826 RepID=UPI003342B3CD